MNPYSNEITKQSGNQDNFSYKSISKHNLSLPSNSSIAQKHESLDKRIDSDIGNHPNVNLFHDAYPNPLVTDKKSNKENQVKVKVELGMSPATGERGSSLNQKSFDGKQKTPQRYLDNFFGPASTSVDQGEIKNSKKRKTYKLVTPERDDEAVTTTKKIKTMSHLKEFIEDPTLDKGGLSDSSVGSIGGGRGGASTKENYFGGPKKITDFFTTKNDMFDDSTHLKPLGHSTKYLSKTKNMFAVIPEEVEAAQNERAKLIDRIKELETKLENNKRERERDNMKAEENLNAVKQEFEAYKGRVKSIIAKMTLQIENYKRMERKAMLNQQKQRLGEYVTQRGGSKFVDVWCDGQEIRSVKEQLANLNLEKEELEKQKKAVKSRKSALGTSKTGETQATLPGGFLTLFGSNENSDSNSNTDPLENRERLNARMTMLMREENMLKERLEKLEEEKALFYQQFKKQYEEDHSRYGKPSQDTNSSAWPILTNKYQLLSLLGKGGFSEVYQAYDLDNFRPVACKIHQLNPNWTENAKNNYVKHANRESDVHKELNHPNIVRLFDCISIDDHSFATVLEYCEGPDLSCYLKLHKILSEKEAKIIIKQILCGLKYLNDHKTKIIHYDLKPQNVMFHKGEIKISDFGLCKVVDPDSTRIELTSQGVGTYWYLPPECFLMDDEPPLISSKVDVWSVGVMFYEMLFGMRPFGHNMSQEKILKEQIILKSYNVSFPSKPIVSNEAKEFIKKCLAYNQENRYDVHQAYNSPLFSKNM